MAGALLEYLIRQTSLFQEDAAEKSGPVVAFQIVCPE